MTDMADDKGELVSPRELAGMIRRAKDCYLWVAYGVGEGLYVRVAHTTAHVIVEEAYESECQEIFAYMEGGDLHIGDELVTEAPEGEGEGAPVEDETEVPE
jgi:hypothetical protein